MKKATKATDTSPHRKSCKISVDLSPENNEILRELKRSGRIKSCGSCINSLITAVIRCDPDTKKELLNHVSYRKRIALHALRPLMRKKEVAMTSDFMRDFLKNEDRASFFGGEEFWFQHDAKIVEECEELEKLLSL